jgi:hypothetical protein
LTKQYGEILTSTSWRLTAPARFLTAWIRNMRRVNC